jgi:hypothetical protein
LRIGADPPFPKEPLPWAQVPLPPRRVRLKADGMRILASSCWRTALGGKHPTIGRDPDGICFDRHLYEPLLYLDQKIVEVSPIPLNKGERNLVEDMREFHDGTPEFFAGKELYLLRNLSKGRGVGFFEAGNFHPDFILWLLVADRQFIAFVDPKGIRNIGFNDPKIQFFQTIKDIEHRLGDPLVTLSSFIISNTPSHQMRLLWAVEKSEMKLRNILFQEEDKASYVGDMMSMIIASAGA